jgi:DNA polymerase-3 subunit delta
MGAIEQLPVMSDRKLIEVAGVPFDGLSDAEKDEWIAVLTQLPQYEYNVLILCAEPDELDPGTAKQPSAALQRFSGVLKPVLFARETPARLAGWIAKHFAANGVAAPPDAVNRLLAECGCDMYTLASEIDKLTWYVLSAGREKLTEADVALAASGSKEIAAFDFANAILDRRPEDALAILKEQERRRERPEVLLSGISRVICDLAAVRALSDAGVSSAGIASRLRMHEYKAGLYVRSAARCEAAELERLVGRCYEADLLIKSTPVDSYTVLDRLAVETAAR